MREKILIIIGLLLSSSIGFMIGQIMLIKTQKPTSIVQKVIDKSLDKYTIENLRTQFANPDSQKGASFQITKDLKDFPTFTSKEFIMEFSPSFDSIIKKTSGLINIPKGNEKHPLIIMIRGYVPKDQYFIGNGTINGSYFFAKNGFITVAPDFLGYADSDKEPDNVFEARFQTYTTITALLKSINQIPDWDGKNVFFWAHSNGGQIALTTLEVTGVDYPTVLWAPVSAPFPYSILYYSVDADDKGKSLRKELAKFEDVYNTDLYSIDNYLDKIKAPIELDQGTSDDAVPTSWSDNLAEKLKKLGSRLTYNKFQGVDHQMNPAWNEVIQRDLEFFRTHIK